MTDKAWTSNVPSLRSWKLSNFKSVKDADIDLAPLTLVVGANSAGKSSLLQSILLMAQAAEEVSSGGFPLNGPLVGLGKFSEALTDIDPTAEDVIRLGGELVLPYPTGRNRIFFRDLELAEADAEGSSSDRRLRSFLWELGLKPDPEGSGALIADSRVHYSRGRDSGDFSAFVRPAGDVPPEMALRSREFRENFNDQYKMEENFEEDIRGGSNRWMPTTRLRPEPSHENVIKIDRRYGAASFMGGIPVNGLAESDEVGWFLSRVEDDVDDVQAVLRHDPAGRRRAAQARELFEAEQSDAISRLFSLLRDDMHRFVESYRRRGAGSDSEIPSRAADHCAILMSRPDYSDEIRPSLLRLLRDDLGDSRPVLVLIPMMRERGMRAYAREIPEFFDSSILYLGPLREDPRVTYPHALAGSSHMPLGRKGESTASVLLQSHSNGRRSPMRGARGFPLPGGLRNQSLEAAVTAWVQQFELGTTVDVQDVARHGVGFTIDRRDLTSVGTGVSQILPVIVLCLMARPGQLVLLEQPELHLNPGLQQHLADFFLAMADSGRQLIVETHSEYLITRLRRRVVEDASDHVRRLFNFVFAEQDDRRITKFKVLDVDENGALGVEEWPKGFFDQAGADVEAMMRIALGKNRRPVADSDV